MGINVAVQLTTRALKDIQKIRAFNDLLLGKPKSKEIIRLIFDRIEILENPTTDYSQTGAIDEDFLHLKHQYRKLLEGYYKITYRKSRNKIYVIRIFDTRQHPAKNK